MLTCETHGSINYSNWGKGGSRGCWQVGAALRQLREFPNFPVSFLGIALGVVPPIPQELIGRPVFAELLQSLIQDFDIVVVDMPAAGIYASFDYSCWCLLRPAPGP